MLQPGREFACIGSTAPAPRAATVNSLMVHMNWARCRPLGWGALKHWLIPERRVVSWRRSSCGLRWRAMKDSRYDAVWLLAGLPYWNHWCDVRVIFEVGAWHAGFEFGPFFLVLPAKVGLWRGRFTKVRFYTVGLLSKGWWLTAMIDYADPWRVFVRKSWSQTHVDSF